MRRRVSCLVYILVFLLLPAVGVAQQGHPLAGVWLGDWGATSTDRTQVVVELIWENTTLSGNINPGLPDAAKIEVGELDSSDWTVHLEAMGTDEGGKPVRTVIDGQLENLGSPQRMLTGTWRSGDVTGDFKLTRE